MHFLITNIGHEDILLGYPWLSTYEPRFSWRHGTIDEKQLPIILQTINPSKPQDVIVRYLSTNKQENIVAELKKENHGELPTIRNTVVELTVAMQQYTKKVDILPEYKRYTKVFSKEESKKFPPQQSYDHAIDFKPGAPDAIACKVYPMTAIEEIALDEWIEEMKAKGYIRDSQSLYASSFFFIKKKDRKLRPVQDYRKFNTWTVCNQYPLPIIRDLVCDLGKAALFTKFDVWQGYNNIRIKEGDKHKAAFKTCHGLYEPMVMFFGLCNSPATFQAFMNDIYHPTIAKHDARKTAIHIYMDDIAIGTQGAHPSDYPISEHVTAVSDVLQVALDHELYFKPEKCTFHAPQIDCLGLILEKGVTRMDPIKISGIKDWPTPKTVKDV
jgi:hypothetical protein